ncbi:MAG: glycosyltransferase family 9 protein [Acidobacteriota bacterium]
MRRLLIRPGAIGDVILSLPALQAASADYTEVWAPRPVLPLIRFADRTRAIIDTGLELVGVVDGAKVPALAAFDSIYSWYGTNRPEFREAVKDLPFKFFPASPPLREGVPAIPVPRVPVGDFAVMHPFASRLAKRWPLESFREAAQQLAMPIKWLAGPEEPLAEAERFDDLYELGCWLARARVYIGNDSGISHLAAAVGVPTIAIFLDSDPEIWAPRGGHVRILRKPTVQDVVEAARALAR